MKVIINFSMPLEMAGALSDRRGSLSQNVADAIEAYLFGERSARPSEKAWNGQAVRRCACLDIELAYRFHSKTKDLEPGQLSAEIQHALASHLEAPA